MRYFHAFFMPEFLHIARQLSRGRTLFSSTRYATLAFALMAVFALHAQPPAGSPQATAHETLAQIQAAATAAPERHDVQMALGDAPPSTISRS